MALDYPSYAQAVKNLQTLALDENGVCRVNPNSCRFAKEIKEVSQGDGRILNTAYFLAFAKTDKLKELPISQITVFNHIRKCADYKQMANIKYLVGKHLVYVNYNDHLTIQDLNLILLIDYVAMGGNVITYSKCKEINFTNAQLLRFRFENRFKSFSNWPKFMRISPSCFARTGFYYTGSGDSVSCFNCSQIICDWSPYMDPQVAHEELSPNCLFARLKRGPNVRHLKQSIMMPAIYNSAENYTKDHTMTQDYGTCLFDFTQNILKYNLRNEMENKYNSLSSKNLMISNSIALDYCVLCYNNVKQILCLPCGHFSVCAECYVRSPSKCHFCKSPILMVAQIQDFNLTSDNKCLICNENRDIAVLPCCHLIYCSQCACNILPGDNCTICKSVILAYVKCFVM